MLADQRARIAQLERLSMTDELTGLFNRRGFTDQLRRQLALARRYGDVGLVVLCDLDRFKEVNDTHGHLAGDKMLRHVGQLLSHSVRETDVVARLGGDEFALVLAKCDPKAGLARVAEIAAEVNAATVTWNDEALPASASFGAAPYQAGCNPDELLHRADISLYRHKRRGPRETVRRRSAA
jgi:diguanylate cyclase (GGDEF)-like protein